MHCKSCPRRHILKNYSFMIAQRCITTIGRAQSPQSIPSSGHLSPKELSSKQQNIVSRPLYCLIDWQLGKMGHVREGRRQGGGISPLSQPLWKYVTKFLIIQLAIYPHPPTSNKCLRPWRGGWGCRRLNNALIEHEIFYIDGSFLTRVQLLHIPFPSFSHCHSVILSLFNSVLL